MELKDPITNVTLTEEQLLAAKLPETLISPSDDENSSIITVRSNASNSNESSIRLHLATDDAENPFDIGSFLVATSQHEPSPSSHQIDTDMQTIVEVVNPLITGDGHANKIAVGHAMDCSYPSFDEHDQMHTGEGEFDSLDATYNTANAMSLSDRMKNVLQELKENERVKLSFSQSISDSDNDSDTKNDTDDENDPLSPDDDDNDDDDDDVDGITIPKRTEENGNSAMTAIFDEQPDNSLNADMKNANVFIYENPNFLMAGDEERNVGTSLQITTPIPRNEREEKLKEKLLSELNVQSSSVNLPTVGSNTNVIEKESDDNDEEESSISVQSDIPTTPTETASGRSSNTSSAATGAAKRRKRKSKTKRK